jgi:hypothetical protein
MDAQRENVVNKLKRGMYTFTAVLVRIVGALWIIGGIALGIDAFRSNEESVLRWVGAVLLFVLGIVLVTALRDDEGDREKLKNIVDRMRRQDSSDDRERSTTACYAMNTSRKMFARLRELRVSANPPFC